jgi:hypothetical protein
MKNLILFSLCLMSVSTFAADAPKYGPTATRLVDSHMYLQRNAARDYWALSGYYVPQQTGSACSIASVSMIVNAARASQKLTASDELATQNNVLKKTNLETWTKAVGDGGHGVTLDELGTNVEKAFNAYGFKGVSVKVIHSDGSKKTNAEILSLLKKNEKSEKDFIVANFLQSEFTGDPEGAVGHIAPVAAFDIKTKRVLIMDPDRTYYEPYWVSTETFLKGLTTGDKAANVNRGIVYVSFQ